MAGLQGSLTSVGSGEASAGVELQTGENVVEVRVTAGDGETVKTYTLTVTRSS